MPMFSLVWGKLQDMRINIYLHTFVYLRLPTYRKAMLKAHVFFAWDFGVSAVTEPVEVQSNDFGFWIVHWLLVIGYWLLVISY